MNLILDCKSFQSSFATYTKNNYSAIFIIKQRGGDQVQYRKKEFKGKRQII